MKTYENYVVVMPAADAVLIANTLANLGIALEGLTLKVEDLFEITPARIHEAWEATNTALEKNWLGTNPDREEGP